MFKDLIINGALFVASLFILGHIYKERPVRLFSPLGVRLGFGALMGVLGVLLMIFSLKITPTVIADLRHLAVVAAAFYGGWPAALLAAVEIAVGRMLFFGVNEFSEVAAVNILLIGAVCGLIACWKGSGVLRYGVMNAVSLVLVTVSLAINLGDDLSPDLLLYHYTGSLVGAVLTYYTARHVIRTNELYRRLEQSVRQNRRLAKQYASVVNSVREVIFQTDREGRMKFLNPVWSEVTGREVEDSLGQSFLAFVHPDDREQNLRLFRELMNGKREVYRHESRLLTEDGVPKWVEVYVTATKEEGTLLGASGTLSDITERKVAEEKVREATQLLRELSHMDGLTGICNRRFFDESLDKELKRAARERTPLSLVMLDIDFFKAYNDTYGHQGGDQCLKSFANALSRTLSRPSDFAARYGGEEFAVVLPNTDAAGALHVAEQLKQSVANLGIPHLGSQIGPFLTCSLGVSTIYPHEGSASAADLIEQADKALYRAKQNGRNRVEVHGAPFSFLPDSVTIEGA